MLRSKRPYRVFVAMALLAGGPILAAPPGSAGENDPVESGAACLFDPQGREAGHEHGHAHGADGEAAGPPWEGLQDVDLSQAFYFDAESGETAALRYRLTAPARVLLRVRDAETRELYLATILNWEPRTAGAHVEIWDGRDYSGNVVDMSRATITLIAQNADHSHGAMDLEARTPEEVVHAEEVHQHGTHHEWAEEVPFLRILEPAPGAETGDLLVIRSVVDEDRRGYGNIYGYGVRYYVDSVLVREEFYKPESDGQFAYRLDTTAFEDGPHLLRVGMCDHHQHATSASVPVVFRNVR